MIDDKYQAFKYAGRVLSSDIAPVIEKASLIVLNVNNTANPCD